MRSDYEIKLRITEIKGELQTLWNKEALGLEMSCEEYDVCDALVAEKNALLWVLDWNANEAYGYS